MNDTKKPGMKPTGRTSQLRISINPEVLERARAVAGSRKLAEYVEKALLAQLKKDKA